MSEPIVPSVHPDLRRHQENMIAEVYTLRGHIHTAFGYSIVNCTLIEGEDACILVDTMTSMDRAEQEGGARLGRSRRRRRAALV